MWKKFAKEGNEGPTVVEDQERPRGTEKQSEETNKTEGLEIHKPPHGDVESESGGREKID